MSTEEVKEQLYGTLITDAGVNAVFVATTEGEKVNIVSFGVGDGDGSYYMPTTDMTELVNEKWRGAVGAYEVNKNSPNMIDVRATVPMDVGGFTIRELAVFSDDGTMVAIANTPDIEKVYMENGIFGAVDVTMKIVLTNAGTLNFIIDSSTITATAEDLANHDKDPDAHAELFANHKGASIAVTGSVPTDADNDSWHFLAFGWTAQEETDPPTEPEVGEPEDPDPPTEPEGTDPDPEIGDSNGKEVVQFDLVNEEMPLNVVIDGVAMGISNVEEQTSTDGTPVFKINRT